MYKKYSAPLQPFLILEHAKVAIFSSNVSTPNHYTLFTNSNYIFMLQIILKYDLITAHSILLDSSCIDTNKYTPSLPIINLFLKKKRLLLFYIYRTYIAELRITILTFLKLTDCGLNSIDLVYKNASWLEREFSEMFSVKVKKKKDIRKLLLDYGQPTNPLLKDYDPTTAGSTYYNVFEEQVVTNINQSIEL